MLVGGKITIFDGIEFNESMRWIDVMSDVGFLLMDLQDRARPDLASRFLNVYLEITGDYEGLDVLRSYLTYRAMVRAKVTRLRMGHVASTDQRTTLQAEYRGYLELAKRYVRQPHPALIITHGPSGCGRTTSSESLAALVGAIRIRTDIERKRAHDLSADARSDSDLDRGLYAPEITQQLYRRLSWLARSVARAGYIVIVDGAFLRRWQCDLFRKLAAELEIPFVIVAPPADIATLRDHITQRIEHGYDASEATLGVLEQ